MTFRTKRKRPPAQGLAPGERLQRDKLAKANSYSRWGWVSSISDQSQITFEHLLVAYGFVDKVGKPICKNKYTILGGRVSKKRKVDVEPERSPAIEDGVDVVVITSDEDEQNICSKKRCKENPQCLNYVDRAKLDDEDAALQSFLKSSNLGPNPLNNARKPGLPVGLKVWFQDHAFRDGVYRCKPSQEEGGELDNSPIFQLQVTFAALQEGAQSTFNPVKFVESLELRVTEQQDAQEFSKLFMSHLATEFEKQAVPSLKTLLADQFEGRLTYGTMCKSCRHRSEQDASFLELEVNVEVNGKLEDSIQALLRSEGLTGDNKYHCARCNNLQDAVRYTRLRKLPPVLHFSVLRFVFDLATISRKKSKQVVQFPLILDMSPFLDLEVPDIIDLPQTPPGGKKIHSESEKSEKTSQLIYELRGVLLHKGASAYHGHYEAQVFDVTSRQFYQFNDETVTPISSLQSLMDVLNGDQGTAHRNQSMTVKNKHRTYSKKKGRHDDSDHEVANNIRNIDHTSGYISSRNAYMLIYARRDKRVSDHGSDPLPQPPPLARQRIMDLNQMHDTACASYEERVTKLTMEFKRRRQEMLDICRQWQISDFKEESAVVSRKALEGWFVRDIEVPRKKQSLSEHGNDHPQESTFPQSSNLVDFVSEAATGRSVSPDLVDLLAPASPDYRLDNTSILCRHGSLEPMKAGEMKRIKKDMVASIRTKTGCFFDPDMSIKDMCYPCVRELFLEKRYASNHSVHVARFDELCKLEDEAEGAWISKAWLKDWRQDKPKMHVRGEADPAPDASEYVNHVKCVHGRLAAAPSFRKWINGPTCGFLKTLFPTWCPIVSRSTELHGSCPTCDKELSLSKEMKQEVKQQVVREKDKLKNMTSDVLASDHEILLGVRQALISSDFLCQWRAWINRPHENPRPGAIDNSWLICKHDRLLFDPNVQRDLRPPVSLVSFSDWEILQDLYGGGPTISLVGLVGPNGSSVPTATHDLEVCQECRDERLSNFETATIIIRILGDEKQQENSTVEVNAPVRPSKGNDGKNGSLLTPGRRDGLPLRTSSRLRSSKQRAAERAITIQKTSTIKEIKIEVTSPLTPRLGAVDVTPDAQLYDELNIPTICQRLFFKGKELTDNMATVASLGVLANDTLELREVKENDGDLDSDQGYDTNSQRDEGQAFGGTVLSGVSKRRETSGKEMSSSVPEAVSTSKHCPVCTYINLDDSSVCCMCGSNTNI